MTWPVWFGNRDPVHFGQQVHIVATRLDHVESSPSISSRFPTWPIY